MGGGRRGLLPPLIDAFSSSQRDVKPLVVLENGIPGQTGCLYGDGRGGGVGWGENSVIPGCRVDVGNGYRGQQHGPHDTPQQRGGLLGWFIWEVRGSPQRHSQGHGPESRPRRCL